MTVIQTNFIKGRMNKSVDERLLPPGEYVDAQNVRLGSTEDTEIGSVENSKGNSMIVLMLKLGECERSKYVVSSKFDPKTRDEDG